MQNSLLPVEKTIQLNRYPLIPGDAKRDSLILWCQEQLERDGACELSGFVSPMGLNALVEECSAMEGDAFFKPVEGNAYLESVSDYPSDHPRSMKEPTRVGVVAYDQIKPDSLLRRIFEWDPLMNFIGAVLKLPQIFRYADTLGALNLSVMKEGDYLRWHFDQTDFVTSLAIQSAESGGEFEYAPRIRRDNDEFYDDVRDVLLGRSSKVRRVPTEPGSLVLFQGRYSLHRVTKVQGGRSRLLGLLAYDSKSGVESTPELQKMRYGRVSKR